MNTITSITCPNHAHLGRVHILRNHFLKSQTENRGWRPPQFVVAVGHNIIEVTEKPFRCQRPPQFVVARGHNILNVSEMIM